MTHLKRAGLVLGILLAGLFGAPRIIPVPESLLAYGFHSSDEAENRQEWAGKPMQYANTSICIDCHQDQFTSWKQADHAAVSCENCHGPAEPHLQGGAIPVVNTGRELCGTCHNQLAARPRGFPQVDMEEHGQGECITCHNPHDPREGIPPEVPHVLDGRSDCQSCHNPQEPLFRVPPHVPHPLEGRSDCLTCHSGEESGGTLLPEIPHDLEGRDNCLACHNTSSIKPFPQNHDGRSTDTCLSCHEKE